MWKIISCIVILTVLGGAVTGSRRRFRRNAVCEDYCSLSANNRTLCPVVEPQPPNRVDTTAQLLALRNAMNNTAYVGFGNELEAYLVYEASYYGGGVTEHDRRMQYISGFSGSSGSIVVTQQQAALWTDGRYWLQGDDELSCDWILMQDGNAAYPNETTWLLDVLPTGSKVGVDPSKIDTQTWKLYQNAFAASTKNIQLVEITPDLFDHIWTNDRPTAPNEPIYEHTQEFAGRTWESKVEEIQGKLSDKEFLIVTLLDDIAWLLNLRGADRATSPLFDSMVFLSRDEIRLYLNDFPKLLTDAIAEHLGTSTTGVCSGSDPCVNVLELSTALNDILGFWNNTDVESIWINPDVGYDLYKTVNDAKRMEAASPIQLIKSQKNPTKKKKVPTATLR